MWIAPYSLSQLRNAVLKEISFILIEIILHKRMHVRKDGGTWKLKYRRRAINNRGF